MGIFAGAPKNAGSSEAKKLHAAYSQLLTDGEIIEAGYHVFRDTFLFTNKRLIVIEIQGISGRQIGYVSIPYSRIMKFCVKTSGSFELDAELQIWIGNDTIPFEKKFNQDVNVYEVQKVLASRVLK